MRCFTALLFLAGALSLSAQTRPAKPVIPPGVPVADRSLESLGGTVDGRTYRNQRLGIEFTVAEDWYIAGEDFEKIAKNKGHDLSVTLGAASTAQAVEVLMTAFRSDASAGAVLRMATEDLSRHTQIRDAVDYIDAVTAVYASTKLPPDFAYSTTKAEKLGSNQFAYLDTKSASGKKRMYASVRNGRAIMFILSYTRAEDLDALRSMLASTRLAEKK